MKMLPFFLPSPARKSSTFSSVPGTFFVTFLPRQKTVKVTWGICVDFLLPLLEFPEEGEFFLYGWKSLLNLLTVRDDINLDVCDVYVWICDIGLGICDICIGDDICLGGCVCINEDAWFGGCVVAFCSIWFTTDSILLATSRRADLGSLMSTYRHLMNYNAAVNPGTVWLHMICWNLRYA